MAYKVIQTTPWKKDGDAEPTNIVEQVTKPEASLAGGDFRTLRDGKIVNNLADEKGVIADTAQNSDNRQAVTGDSVVDVIYDTNKK
jgi:hypothetical protein